MNLSDLRTHVWDLLGQDATTAEDAWSATRIDRFLNRAAKHVAQIIKRYAPEEFTKTATFNTVVGTREYDLLTTCTGFQDLHAVERAVTGSTRPEPLVVDRVFSRGFRHIPNRLYLRDHYLGFYAAPTEAKELTIHYSPDVAAMTATTNDLSSVSFQNPRIRDAFHDVIVYRAAYLALMAEGGSYQPLKQEAAEKERDMIQTLRRRRRGPHWMSPTLRVCRAVR